ncbi:MAG: hypothetical protein GY937_14285 [bacterium]|nr:hypothetical protein [bacterium]
MARPSPYCTFRFRDGRHCGRAIHDNHSLCLFHRNPSSVAEILSFWKAFSSALSADSGDVDLRGAVFPASPQSATTDFVDLEYDRGLNLQGARFPSETGFSGCSFSSLDLSESIFERPVSIDNCRFGALSLNRSTISSRLTVNASQIETARIVHARITAAIINASQFDAFLCMDSTLDGSWTVDQCCFSKIDLCRAEIRGDVAVASTEIRDGIDLRASHIFGTLSFSSPSRATALGHTAGFHHLRFGPEGKLVFDGINLSNASFLGTPIDSNISFRDVRWARRRRFLGRDLRMLRDESRLPIKAPDRSRALVLLHENYRELVLDHRQRRQFSPAEDFHVGEMECLRRRLAANISSPWWRRLRETLNLLMLYRLLSLYGTSYGRAVSALAALILALAVLVMLAGIEGSGGGSLVHYSPRPARDWGELANWADDLRRTLVYMLEVVTLQRDRLMRPVGLSARALISLAPVLVAGQGALVLFALRNSFRR